MIKTLRFLLLFAGLTIVTLAPKCSIAQQRDEIKQPIDSFRGKTVVIKQRLSGSAPFGSALSNQPSWGIFEIANGSTIKITQSTLVLNALFGNAKWWDHTVTASRACKMTSGGWDNPLDCIEGAGNTIILSPSADFRDYIFEFKWEESGTIKFWKTEITGLNNEKQAVEK